MSEVKRYTPSMRVGHMVQDKDGLWNRSQDFDRVTAERDAALGREAVLREELSGENRRLGACINQIEEQQQRLTAAEALLRHFARCADVRQVGTLAMESALKPAEPTKCERCGCSTVETCDELGCGYLGAGNGAPE